MKLSVVVVTENAQDILTDCLESAQWADEIVVVDAESDDATIEIARRFTDKIIRIEITANHGQRWNRGIAQAMGDWLFLLESDKRISPELKKEIEGLAQTHRLDEQDGYLAKTRNYFLGHWLKMEGFYPDHKLYLVKKEQARFEERAKGGVVFNGRTGYLENDVPHYVYRSIVQSIDKINKDSTVMAKEFFTAGAGFKKSDPVLKPLKLFKKMYYRQGGNKQGMMGLACCVITTFERFLVYAKLWHLKKANSEPTI